MKGWCLVALALLVVAGYLLVQQVNRQADREPKPERAPRPVRSEQENKARDTFLLLLIVVPVMLIGLILWLE